MSDNMIEFQITTGFGHNTQKPFVNVTVGAKDFHIQMQPEDVIDLAYKLLAAAEAATQDAFFVTFMRKNVGLGDAEIAVLLGEYRAWRERQGGLP